jgi:hypothetical protein
VRQKESGEDDRDFVQNGPCPKASLMQVIPLQNDSKTGMHERILAEAYKEPMIQHRQDFDRFLT